MKAKKVYETIENILKPKTREELIDIIPMNLKNVVDNAYREVRDSPDYVVIYTPAIDNEGGYRFKFRTKDNIEYLPTHASAAGISDEYWKTPIIQPAFFSVTTSIYDDEYVEVVFENDGEIWGIVASDLSFLEDIEDFLNRKKDIMINHDEMTDYYKEKGDKEMLRRHLGEE